VQPWDSSLALLVGLAILIASLLLIAD
jgi:hypothetical protein